MLANFHVRTSHLILRPVTPADKADLIGLEADAEVMRYLNGGQAVPEAGVIDAGFLTPRGEEPEVVTARHRKNGAFIGWFALFDDGLTDGLRTAEVGYRLVRSSWGKGYATEGVQALIEVAFDSLGFDRISAETLAVNHASRRVLEKAGFRHIKTASPNSTLSVSDAEHSDAIYEICKANEKAAQPLRNLRGQLLNQ